MKKRIIAVFVLLTLLSLWGCSGDTSSAATEQTEKNLILNNTDQLEENANGTKQDDPDLLIIGEDIFSDRINFITFNPESYIGKTIQYEGMYGIYQDLNGNDMDVVYRYGPGHCTEDDVVGFEVIYDGDVTFAENDWLKVTGTLQYVNHGGLNYLAVVLSDLQVLEERGAETVA